MLDALKAVSELSLALQGDECSLAKGHQLLRRTIRHLNLQKESKMGDHYEAYMKSEGVFSGVDLKEKGTYLKKVISMP